MKVIRGCKNCNKSFYINQCWVKRGEGNFCSRKCQGIFRSLNFRLSEETKRKIGRNGLGKKRTLITRTKISVALKGRRVSDETRKKQSIAKKGLYLGSLHPNWKGGLTSIYQKIRNSQEYSDWRKAVFERDDYTCQECGKNNIYLNADHIKPFALYPKLRLAIDNGRTLCVQCHRKTDTYAGRVRKFQNV